jgi:hypothetical protein
MFARVSCIGVTLERVMLSEDCLTKPNTLTSPSFLLIIMSNRPGRTGQLFSTSIQTTRVSHNIKGIVSLIDEKGHPFRMPTSI